MTSPKVIVALDCPDWQTTMTTVQSLSPTLCRLKIGITLFTRYGNQLVDELTNKGFEIFLDCKFHDIPEQVAGACLSAAKQGIWLVNVHALGGKAMLKAARQALAGTKTLLIGVTLLTSMEEADLQPLGLSGTIAENVKCFASLCFEAGLDGVVCSAKEVSMIKQTFGAKFLCVTPGIRLPGDHLNSQKRVMDPVSAITAGSDYLVMGRSILNSVSPAQTLSQINAEIEAL